MPTIWEDFELAEPPAKSEGVDWSDFEPVPDKEEKRAALAEEMAQVRREAIVGNTMEKAFGTAQQVLEPLTPSGLMNQPARIARAITGETYADPFTPGKAAIAEVPEPKGPTALAGLGKFGARLVNAIQSPESLVTLPTAAVSAPVRALFAMDIARHLPESVKQSAEVLGDIESTPAEKVVAALTPPSEAFMVGLLSKSGGRPFKEPPWLDSALRMPAGAKPSAKAAPLETPEPTPGEIIQKAVEREPLVAESPPARPAETVTTPIAEALGPPVAPEASKATEVKAEIDRLTKERNKAIEALPKPITKAEAWLEGDPMLEGQSKFDQATIDRVTELNTKIAELRKNQTPQIPAVKTSATERVVRPIWQTAEFRTPELDKKANRDWNQAKERISRAQEEQRKIKPTKTGFSDQQKAIYEIQQRVIDANKSLISQAEAYAKKPQMPVSVGPGAASPTEFAERLQPTRPPPNQPVAVDASAKPDVEIVRKNKDYHLFNVFNSSQWAFDFGRLGQAAKSAWERMALGEFKMRESIKRDTQTYVRDLLASVPREMRKNGGKAFFDVIDGRRMEEIINEWQGKPGGEKVIAAAEQLKTRLEEIRTTIRDTKRDSYRTYLQGLNRDPLETMFRNTINDKVDTSNMTKEQFADALTLSEFPDDWGIADGSYLPHLFFGNWKVEAKLPGDEQASFVTRAKTAAEAKAKIYELSRNNPEYANAKWTVGQDTIIPADMIRLGDRKFWNLISRMKQQTEGEINVKEAVQGIVGRKASKQKWFGSLQKREGFENYSQDFQQVMSAYLNGFHRWKELSSMQREVQPMIDQVRSEGRLNAAKRLDDIMENLWGKPTQSTILFDAFVRQIPGLRNVIKPLALDRWSRNIRSMVSLLSLSTARFALINRLQPLQGLYPIVGERLLVKGKALQHTAEGKALLDEAGVSFDPGQYADTRGGLSKARDVLERLRGERTNQEWAFLSMYLHGLEQGMPKPEAIKYAKLRGQLMTQFTPLISDTPQILHGPVTSAIFQFKRFPIKQVELVANMVRNGQIGGIARMLAMFGLVGGASFFLRQAWADKSKRLALQRKLQDELGEQGANALMYGLPGLLNADLSGSLILADEPLGDDIYAKAGRTLAGPAPSMAIDIARAATIEQREPMSAKEKVVGILRRFPTLRPIAELLSFNDDEILAPDGETKYRRKVADALVSIGSFRSAHEANQRTAVDAIVELKKEEASLKNAYYVSRAGGGDMSKVLADIEAFNKRWPEVRITRGDLTDYMEYRRANARKTDTQRMAGKKYRRLVVP